MNVYFAERAVMEIKLVSLKNSSIRNQMLIMFLVVILPLFAASVILLVNMRSAVADKLVSTANSKADSYRNTIMNLVDVTEAYLDSFVTDEEVIAFLENDYEGSGEYYKYYGRGPHQKYVRSLPLLDSIKVYTERESFLYNNDYMYADESIREQAWYKDARLSSNEFIWSVSFDQTDKKWYLSCSKAVKSGNRVVGVASAMVSDSRINRMDSQGDIKSILCVGEGNVFFSNSESITAGGKIEFDESISLSSGRNFLEGGLLGFNGNVVTESFTYKENFQIILLIPSSVADIELNKYTIIYGGYFSLFFILSLLIIVLFTSVFSRRITFLSEKMHAVAGGDFDVEISDEGNDEIAQLYTDLELMINSMQTMMNDVYQAKLQNEEFKFIQMEAEFKALASQINPHFLYNTLETIRMKAFCNNDKETADLVKKLGKFMRRCLEFKDGEVTLRSELEFTNGYLELQSARFGDRVSYSIYSEVSKDYMILPLVIQPVVENAFVHGIESCKINGRIDIRVYYSGENVIIDVNDNGVGMNDTKLAELEAKLRHNDTSSGKSIGLTNVNKRIKMYHGEQYGLTIKTKEGEGTTITITLPRKPAARISAENGRQAENER